MTQGDGKQVHTLDGATHAAGGDVITQADAALTHDKDATDEVAENGLRGEADGNTCNTCCAQYADEVYANGPQSVHDDENPQHGEYCFFNEYANLPRKSVIQRAEDTFGDDAEQNTHG